MIQSSYYTSYAYAREQRVIDELVARIRPHELPQAALERDLTLDAGGSDDELGAEESIRLFKPTNRSHEREQPLREAVALLMHEVRTCYIPAAQRAIHGICQRAAALSQALTQPTEEVVSAPSVAVAPQPPTHLAIEAQSKVEAVPIRVARAYAPRVASAPGDDALAAEQSVLMLTLRILIARLFGTYNIVDTQAR